MRKRTPTKLEISAWFSSEIDKVETWTPERPEDVHYHLWIDIGVQGEQGTNCFHATIVTHEALRWRGAYGHGVIVLQDYSWATVTARLNEILQECTKNTWEESVDCLRRHFRWEYEGMA